MSHCVHLLQVPLRQQSRQKCHEIRYQRPRLSSYYVPIRAYVAASELFSKVVGRLIMSTLYILTEPVHYLFRVSRLPVFRNPLSPIALRHSIESCPRVARPSRFRSFCNASRPSCWPGSCSTRKATWRTSRGFKVGRWSLGECGVCRSQLSDRALNGDLGLRMVCYQEMSIKTDHQENSMGIDTKTDFNDNRTVPDIFQLCLKCES